MDYLANHIHISEREGAHTWPDGRSDNAKWEDCTWDSTVEWVRLTHDPSIPATHREAEALRADSGEDVLSGSNLASDVPRGLLKRYKLTVSPGHGFSALMPRLLPGVAAVVTGMMGAFPTGHRLRRWDPGFTGAHALLALRLDDGGRVWWCDPLAPVGSYKGEWVTMMELQSFVDKLTNALWLVGNVLGDEPMRPLPITDKTTGKLAVKTGAQLYLPDLTPKVTASNVSVAYSPFATVLGGVAYRAAYILTGGVNQLLLVKVADSTFAPMAPSVADDITQATVDAAIEAQRAADAANLIIEVNKAAAAGAAKEKSRLRALLGL